MPLFLMLSGALLLRKTESIRLFFEKRLKRILVPFLIWSLVVFVLRQIENASVNIHNMSLQFVNEFFTFGTHGVYWYIYLIIGLYFVTPILRIFFVYTDKKNVYYFGEIMVLMTCSSKLFPEFMVFSRFESLNLIYLTYFVMGHIISKYLTKETFYGIPFHLFVRVGLIISVLGGFTEKMFGICPDFPWIFFTSIFLFSCLISSNFNRLPNRICQIINFISSTSYGIYLSHFMLISLFVKLNLPSYMPLWLEPFFMTIIVLSAEMFIMYIIKKIRMDIYLM